MPSAIRPAGQAFIENDRGEGELVPFVTPRALDIVEMPYIVQQYERGARNALIAGFDGVEIHGANGYMLDQFINSQTNTRTDAYGGLVGGRSRYASGSAVRAASTTRSPTSQKGCTGKPTSDFMMRRSICRTCGRSELLAGSASLATDQCDRSVRAFETQRRGC
jgi:NADH:flavin oxidoreductase/NADH oxidase family protein